MPKLEDLCRDILYAKKKDDKWYAKADKAIKRIAEIETALQGMVPFIEDDFPNGTGTNHGTCATDEYQQACDVVIKALNS